MISLSSEIQNLIEERMRRGGYPTADDVVRAGLALLAQQERLTDFGPGELDRLLAAGEAEIEAGNLLDGEVVFRELEARSDARRNSRST